MVQKGWADAVLVAPPGGLTKSVQRGDGQLQLIVDASNAVRARAIETYLQSIILEVGRDQGLVPAQAGGLAMDVRFLFNPSMQTPLYLVPGVMCMILCLMTIVLTSMSIAREKEMGTLETLISAPIKTWEIILGKTLPFVVLGLFDVPLILGVAMGLFKVPMRGQVWELAVAAVIFVCTTVSVGMLISTFARNQQQAMMGGFLFLFPAIQLSGVMAPLDNIPLAFKAVAYLNPLQYFVALLRNIMLKGGNPWVVWSHIGVMALLGLIFISISFKRFHRTLN
jgi:ABC-2 type transport system permease protein